MNKLIKSILLFPILLLPIQAYASDTFQNIPDTHVTVGTKPTIGDYNTATEASPDTDDSVYWDISPFVNASSSFNLSIVSGGSTTTTQTIDGKYLNLWTRGVNSYTPFCDPYVTNGAGVVKGTLQGYPTPTTRGDASYTWYEKSIGGNSIQYTLCQYVMLASSTVMTGGMNFTAGTSSATDFFHMSGGGGFYGGGRIYALYSTASSTEHEFQNLAGCTGVGRGDCTLQFEQYLINKNIDNTDSTHIISFTPNDGDVLSASSSVNFSIKAYIHPDDCCSSAVGVRIILHNIDQNTLLSSISHDDIVLYNALATSSGYFTFATSTMISAGNYRVNAVLDRALIFGIFRNPFSSVNANLSHQFIVGTSTFLGNISQNSFGAVQTIFGSYNSTSTQALAGSCNLLSGFDTLSCLAFLFVPSADQIDSTITSFRAEIGKKVPLGYLDRFVTILTDTSTAPLPSFTVHILTGTNEATTATFNMGDTISGGGALLDSVSSPVNHVSVKDVFTIFVQLLVALAVLFTIISDLSGSHKHENPHN